VLKLYTEGPSAPLSVINLYMHQPTDKASYSMITDSTMSAGSERRCQSLVEMEAIIEQAAQ
jgi:hypothetical protein